MDSLTGKNIVIIGGTSGIGLATAIQASDEGANVWAVGRSEDRVKSAASQFPNINFVQIRRYGRSYCRRYNGRESHHETLYGTDC